MAFSIGPRAGGGDGSGSSKVGVASAQQTTNLTLTDDTFVDANFHTPAFQITQKSSAKAAITFGGTIVVVFSGGSGGTGTIATRVKLRMRKASTETGFSGNTGWADVNIVDGSELIFQETQRINGLTTAHQQIGGEVPFDLSILSGVDNSEWVQFLISIECDKPDSPSTTQFYMTKGSIALKAFGVGAASTDIDGGDIRNNTITNAKLSANSVNTNQIVDGAVTRPKIGADAVDGTKIADNAIGNEHIADNAVQGAQIDTGAVGSDEIAANAVSAGKIGANAVGNSNIAAGAVRSSQIQDGSVIRAKLADDAVDGSKIADNSITPAKVAGVTASGNTDKVVAIDSGGGFKLVTPASGGISTVVPSDLQGIASTDTQQFIKTNFDGTGFTHQSAIGPSDLSVGASGDQGRFVKVKSDGTGFETATGGGSLTSVDPSDLDGVTGGSGDASKFVKTDSTGNQFDVESHIDVSDLNITDSSPSGKFVTIDSAGTGFTTQGDLTPKFIGLTEGNDIQGLLVSINSTGDGFTTTEASDGGATVTLANITGGPLATNKGGTGLNASDQDDLRTKLGIKSAETDAPIPYNTDVGTQKNNTLHRVNSSTASLPSGVGDGIVVRINNDQWVMNLSDGKQWIRTLTDTPGSWVAQNNPTIQTANTVSAIYQMTDTSVRRITDAAASAVRPSFTDGSHPDEVLIARHDNPDGNEEYLIAIDRNNFWWAPRPSSAAATSIAWQWEGVSRIPQGLLYSGGETDEEHIPVGSAAVLGSKSGIDGAEYINVLVVHTINNAKTTSTYAGYWIDDDFSKTIRQSNNQRGYVQGTWSRTRLDTDGISSDIFVSDTDADGNERPAFVGVVPAISDLHFSGYTYKTTQAGISEGDVAYIASTRTVWVYHKTEDVHLPTLFDIDYEVSIEKDSTNYIRGVFNIVRSFDLPGGVSLSGAEFRQADLDVTGTIASGDDVSIVGHKAVLTKTDTIGTVNISNGAITPSKIAGADVSTAVAGQVLKLNTAKTGFEFANDNNTGGGGGGVPADDSITSAMLKSNIITNAKMADDSVGAAELIDDSVGNAAMADNAIDTAQLAADAVTGAKIEDDAIANEHIANGAVDTDQLAADAVTGAKIADNAVDTEHLANDAVENANIANGAVDTDQLAADAVTDAKIADDAVRAEHIQDDAVGKAAIADNSIDPARVDGVTPGASLNGHALVFNSAGTGFTTAVLPSGSGGSDVPHGRVYLANTDGTDDNTTYSTSGDKTLDESDYTTVFKITNRASAGGVFYFNGTLRHNSTQNQTWKAKVQARWASTSAGVSSATNWTDCDIFNGTAEFFDESITGANRNLDHDYSIALPFNFSDLPSLAADNQWIQFRVRYTLSANLGTNITWTRKGGRFYGVSLTGGASGVADGSIDTAQLADDAVENSKLADNAVGNENISTGAVDTDELAADAVTGAKIADNAVANEHIATNAVQTEQLNADAVTGAKIADDAVDTEHLADDAVEAAAIATGAVGSDALAADAVTEAKLADNAVVPANIKGVTAGSGIASKVLAFDGNGTSFVAVEQASGGGGGSGTLLYGKMTSDATSVSVSASNSSVFTNDELVTPSWEVANKSTAKAMLFATITIEQTGGWDSFLESITQYRYASSESDLSSATWNDAGFADLISTYQNRINSTHTKIISSFGSIVFSISDLSGLSDGDYVQFRVSNRIRNTSSSSRTFVPKAGSYIAFELIGGSSGGGSSTPTDGSITTAKLAGDAVTNAKLADGAVDLENLANQYKVLDDSYTFQADVSSGVDDGKFGYTDSGLNGQVAFNVKASDSGAVSEITTDSILVLWKDASNFVIGRATAAPQTEAGDSTEGAVAVNELERKGTFADGDAVKLYYGSDHEPGAVMQVGDEGNIVIDHLSPASMAIPQASAYGGRVITTNTNADGFLAVPSANVGLIKYTLLCRQEVAGSGEISVTSSNANDTRAALQTQTGTWTVANQSTDWIRFSAGGLCYFGTPTAQPICADFAVLVRWANGTDTFQSWSTANSRVDQVDLGTDRLMVVKLYAGNSAGNAHVDCAVGSGYKFLKLSQLPSGITNGTRVQFTLGFAFQSPSPTYTARRFFLTGEVLDGGRISANY